MRRRTTPGMDHYFNLLEESIANATEKLQTLKESIGKNQEDRLSIAQELASDSYRIVGISAVLGRFDLERTVEHHNAQINKVMNGEL